MDPYAPPDSYDPDRDRYEDEDDGPALRAAGVFVLLHGLLEGVAVLLQRSLDYAKVGGPATHPRVLVAIGVDFVIGVLLWWQKPSLRWWALARAALGIVLLLLASDQRPVAIELALAVAFGVALALALIGSPGRVRVVLACLVFAAYAIVTGGLEALTFVAMRASG